MLRKKLLKNAKGDTIVEVLLAIAVMSLVLTISYALSNRDSKYIQESQERSEAQNISEQQLELLRNYLSPTSSWSSTYKCFTDAGQPTDGSGGECKKGIKDDGVNGRYNVQIAATDTNSDSSLDTYTVTATWSSLTSGTVQQSLALSYKLPIASISITGVAKQCNDGSDNDGDGLVDLADSYGCTGPTDNDEFNAVCYDGGDNDGDGLIDYPDDPGCTSASDNDEYNPPPAACEDGEDNDGDGVVDYPDDPGCDYTGDNDEYNPCGPAYKGLGGC